MIKWVQQYLAVSRNSFEVLISDPLIFLMNLFFIGMTALTASLPGFTFGEQIRLFCDQSLAMAFSGGCLAVALASAHLISEDMQGGMVSLVFSRPVRHGAFIAGKWTGIVAVMAVLLSSACVSCLWGTRIIFHEEFIETLGMTVYVLSVLLILGLLTLRHYLFRGNFLKIANLVLPLAMFLVFLVLNFWGYDGKTPSQWGALVRWESAYGYLFIFMAIAVFSSITCCFATIFDQALILVIGAIVFFGGLFDSYFIGMLPYANLMLLIESVVPGWQTYWISDSIHSSSLPSLRSVSAILVQTLAQSGIYLVLATIIFKSKELSQKD